MSSTGQIIRIDSGGMGGSILIQSTGYTDL